MVISEAGRRMTEYAIYKGETLLCIGTRWECAEHLGIKPDTIRHYAKPHYMKRVQKRKNARNYIVAIKLDDEEV